MKKTVSLIFFFLFFSAKAFAATYYASPTGGGAASCVDNSANVCTLQRAITVAATGTHTIELANGSYTCSTSCNFTNTNTGANLTFQPASGATATVTSSGATYVFDIQNTMVSGSLTFNNVGISDSSTDYLIANRSPEVNVTVTGGSLLDASDATVGTAIYYPIDTTNLITLASGEDTTTNLRTGATTNTKIAQKIVVGGSNITVNRASFKLRKRCGNKGSNCDEYVSGESWDYRNAETLTVTIETDSAGAPSGTPVTNGTAQTVLATSVPWRSQTGEWISFKFSSNVSLTASTTYWVVITGNYTASASNYIEVATDTGDGYASGDSSTYNGTSWTGASAGTDLLFTVDRAHTRDLTVTGSTISSRAVNISLGWADEVNIDGNSLTSTASGTLNISSNNQWTTSDSQFYKVLLNNNTINATTNLSKLVNAGVSGFAKTYTELLVIKGNTGVVSIIAQPFSFVRRLLIQDNNLEVQYAGNVPLQLGREPDASDPPEYNYQPFEQILIEDNTFNFSATTHNHLFLFAIGSENGIMRNNKLYAYNAGSGSRAWGVVVKANAWTIFENEIFGVAPAIAVYGTNNSRVFKNTVECFGSGGDGCILVRRHQDSVYGPTRYGVAFHNYIKDNIVIGDDSTFEGFEYGTSTSDATDDANRNSKMWSNVIDNNVYWSKTNSTFVSLSNPSTTTNVASGDGYSALAPLWAGSTHTDKTSMSIYNDSSLNGSFSLPTFIDASTANFATRSASVTGKGTRPRTSIGAYQQAVGPEAVGTGN